VAAPDSLDRNSGDTTVFKSVGLGVQDIAVAGFVYEESLRLRKGSELPVFHS
jgi:ornithine cyclodeaminase/alanine dehydrogenase-like protein (mu-crystallin family)